MDDQIVVLFCLIDEFLHSITASGITKTVSVD